ncbi:MAG: nuclear transport factor 2 family protein [Burkholderiales bacterium]|nr:MAG: nuclear transport factor 2 family protein [Burkholderiales bacterium]
MRRAPIFATAEAVEDAFYDAMERADLEAMMSLWADDDDVVCVHPGGPRLVGVEAIRRAWADIFRGGSTEVRPAEVRTYQSATLCVRNVVEQVIVRGAGSTEIVRILATNVYIKGPLGWQIVLHHAASPGEGPGDPIGARGVLH